MLYEVITLIRIVAPPPGAPPELVMTTPAVLPTRRSWAEVMFPLLKSSALIAVTEPVASSFLTVP